MPKEARICKYFVTVKIEKNMHAHAAIQNCLKIGILI